MSVLDDFKDKPIPTDTLGPIVMELWNEVEKLKSHLGLYPMTTHISLTWREVFDATGRNENVNSIAASLFSTTSYRYLCKDDRIYKTVETPMADKCAYAEFTGLKASDVK